MILLSALKRYVKQFNDVTKQSQEQSHEFR